MKIVPLLMKIETLYENRHLYTDDVKYNSLIVSNIFNLNIDLISNEDYDNLEHEHKKQIYDANNSFNYILSKHGIYIQTNIKYDLVLYSWQLVDKKYINSIIVIDELNILTIV